MYSGFMPVPTGPGESCPPFLEGGPGSRVSESRPAGRVGGRACGPADSRVRAGIQACVKRHAPGGGAGGLVSMMIVRKET